MHRTPPTTQFNPVQSKKKKKFEILRVCVFGMFEKGLTGIPCTLIGCVHSSPGIEDLDIFARRLLHTRPNISNAGVSIY